MSLGTLLIRADANPRTGMGHIMRSLALAQTWRDHGSRVVLATNEPAYSIVVRFKQERIPLEPLNCIQGDLKDAQVTIALAKKWKADWIAIDGYEFLTTYQRAIKESRLRLLSIDDWGHAKRYKADLILNQNIFATDRFYACRDRQTELLLGPSYALLRKEFLTAKKRRRKTRAVAKNLLLTLGGSDPNNVTSRILHCLGRLKDNHLSCIVIIGPTNPHLKSIRSSTKNLAFKLELSATNQDMPQLMKWADLCISAGGTSCYELAYMGLPTVMIAIADNQREAVDALSNYGFGTSLGWWNDLNESKVASVVNELIHDPRLRKDMTERGEELLDGKGSERVFEAMKARH